MPRQRVDDPNYEPFRPEPEPTAEERHAAWQDHLAELREAAGLVDDSDVSVNPFAPADEAVATEVEDEDR